MEILQVKKNVVTETQNSKAANWTKQERDLAY